MQSFANRAPELIPIDDIGITAETRMYNFGLLGVVLCVFFCSFLLLQGCRYLSLLLLVPEFAAPQIILKVQTELIFCLYMAKSTTSVFEILGIFEILAKKHNIFGFSVRAYWQWIYTKNWPVGRSV